MDKNWTKSQENAINATGGTVLVAAAAGSGKTSVLVERVIRRITHPTNPVDIDKFLIVTFTKAAASEMKSRIHTKLSQLIMKNPQDANLHRQQMLLKCASIGTIHSFCSNIIKENFYTLGISPTFRIIDDSEKTLIKDRAAEKTLNRFFEQNTPEFKTVADLFASEKDDKNLVKIINQIYDFTRSLPLPEKWMKKIINQLKKSGTSVIDSPWGELILKNAKTRCDYASKLCEEMCELAKIYEPLKKAYLEALEKDLASIKNLQKTLNSRNFEKIRQNITSFSFAKLGALKSKEFESEKTMITTRRKLVKNVIAKIAQDFFQNEQETLECIKKIGDVTEILFELTNYFAQEISDAKALKNLADFNDLEHLAIKLLTKESGEEIIQSAAAQEIASRYEEIMIDEYQDINEIQSMIFKMISNHEANIFSVGDVKQSIYKFRSSRPQIFLQKKSKYQPYDSQKDSYPAKIILGQNFRSNDGIIKSINFIFEHLMSEKVGEIQYNSEESLTPGASYPQSTEPDTELKILDTSLSEENPDILEARLIAETITKMISQGYMVYEDSRERPIRYGDFCVLLRSSNAHAHLYAKELFAEAVPSWSETNEKFLGTAEISTIVSALQVIDNPTKDIPLLATLISPLFGFTLDEISDIRQIDKDIPLYFALKQHAQNGNEKSENFLQKIDAYRHLAATISCPELINYIYDESDYPALCLALPRGKVKRANLKLLVQYAEKFEKENHKGLAGFLRFIETIKQKGSDLEPASISSETENTVKIMSIHKSKGLEFPVCIIAGCSRKFNLETSKVVIHPELGVAMKLKNENQTVQYDNLVRKAISSQNRAEDISEELRIFYVALTRAKQKLILIASMDDPTEAIEKSIILAGEEKKVPAQIVQDASSFAQWILLCAAKSTLRQKLCELAGIPKNSTHDNLPPLFWDVQIIHESEDESPQTNNEPFTPPAPLQAEDKLWAKKIKERFEFVYPEETLAVLPLKVSASLIGKGEQWQQHIACRVPNFMASKTFGGTDKGTAMHKFMCYANFKSIANLGVPEQIKVLAEKGFLDSYQIKMLDIPALESFFKSNLAKEISKSPKVLREHRFSVKISPKLLGNEFESVTTAKQWVVLQGALDCAFWDENGYIIVDYKTDKTASTKELFEKYRKQLELYKYALEKSQGARVKKLVIYSFYLNQEYSQP